MYIRNYKYFHISLASSSGSHSIASPNFSISSLYTCMKSMMSPYFSGNSSSQYLVGTECGVSRKMPESISLNRSKLWNCSVSNRPALF